METPPKPIAHSAAVEMSLKVGYLNLSVAQLGPDFLILHSPICSHATEAVLVFSVDGKVSERNIYLPNGISDDSVRIKIETPPGPIDKTGEEAKRLGLPVPPKPSIERFSLINRNKYGYEPDYVIAADHDGDYVLFTDYAETAAERDVLKSAVSSLRENAETQGAYVLSVCHQRQEFLEERNRLREVNAELLSALKQITAYVGNLGVPRGNSYHSAQASIAKASV